MKIAKIILGGLFFFMALMLLIQAFQATPPESYEKLAAFVLMGGLAFWFLRSGLKKKNDNNIKLR